MPSRRRNIELWLALFAILAISMVYILTVIWFDEVPGSSGLFGHGIGVVGFVLMLMTETLYTLRKRSRNARWGRMSTWLNFHIFTGLVGPFMVLLHSAWKFNGFAGVVMLLTAIVVASGFIGRYIYTAVPRSADGSVVSVLELETEIANMEMELQRLLSVQMDTDGLKRVENLNLEDIFTESQAMLIWGRIVEDWTYRIRWWRFKGSLSPADRAGLLNLEELLMRKRRLHYQVRSQAVARRLLSLWHSIHLPIGIVLFIAAFIHIIAAVYYATLFR